MNRTQPIEDEQISRTEKEVDGSSEEDWHDYVQREVTHPIGNGNGVIWRLAVLHDTHNVTGNGADQRSDSLGDTS